ncbi:hypothetical protein MMPV_010140 [Pyropia vietnamensis]
MAGMHAAMGTAGALVGVTGAAVGQLIAGGALRHIRDEGGGASAGCCRSARGSHEAGGGGSCRDGTAPGGRAAAAAAAAADALLRFPVAAVDGSAGGSGGDMALVVGRGWRYGNDNSDSDEDDDGAGSWVPSVAIKAATVWRAAPLVGAVDTALADLTAGVGCLTRGWKAAATAADGDATAAEDM